MTAFAHLTLVQRFLLTGGAVLLVGMTVVAAWVGRQIEIGVINRTSAVTSIYVQSAIAPHVQSLADGGDLLETDRSALNRLLTGTVLGRQIVAFNIWRPDGSIVYSTNPALVGLRFQVTAELASALAGRIRSQVADPTREQHKLELPHASPLIETHVPIHARRDGNVVAVAEFYRAGDGLMREVRAAQRRSWLMFAAATLLMFALLAGLVRRANNTIVGQQQELRDKLAQLTALLKQNEQLHERVRRAAARTTALNERFLHRVAADLHDGPAQCLALALLRMEALADVCSRCCAKVSASRTVAEDFGAVHSALKTGLADLRAIAAGLNLPELEHFSCGEAVRCAVRNYERNSGLAVETRLTNVPDVVPLPVKIGLYRLVQESLANGYRHAGAAAQRVTVARHDGHLLIDVSDDGKGFEPDTPHGDSHLGLVGMRERVETLGGTFTVDSALGKGTSVRAMLPLVIAGDHD